MMVAGSCIGKGDYNVRDKHRIACVRRVASLDFCSDGRGDVEDKVRKKESFLLYPFHARELHT